MEIKNPIYNEIKTKLEDSEKELFNIFLWKKSIKLKRRRSLIECLNSIFEEYERFPEENEILPENIKDRTHYKSTNAFLAYNLYKKFYNTPKRKLLGGELDLKKRKVLIERLKEFGFEKKEAIEIVKDAKTLEELENKIKLKLF